jgi:isopropylmalate/citramalate/homocitrate synthase-like protein
MKRRMKEEEVFVSDFIDDVRSGFKLPGRVRVFDTTLRDGEQTPGVSLTAGDKLEIARALDGLRVDTIEAGFPISSEGERAAIRGITSAGLRAEICGLARTVDKDIDAAVDCGVGCVHAFIGTSDLHLKYKLKMTREQALETAVRAVERVKASGLVCEFSCEDATRTSLDYMLSVYEAAVGAGADRLNVADTVGAMVPEAMYSLISRIKERIKAPISIHCHNDFGLAVANTLAGITAGAEQAHVTLNGLGERAGNASLEQTVMGLRALYRASVNIDVEALTRASSLVERLTRVYLPPNYPIVGRNAFAHESGIHVHGVLSKAATYEPLTPEMVGQRRKIVLGKHTGVHAVEKSLSGLGIRVNREQLLAILERIKGLGDDKKSVGEEDLLAIAESVVERKEKSVVLDEVVVTTGNKLAPSARVKLRVNGEERAGESTGVGPVDAAARTIQRLAGSDLKLRDYRLEAITGGTEAVASVEIEMETEKRLIFKARAMDKDIVMASVMALVECINKARHLGGER